MRPLRNVLAVLAWFAMSGVGFAENAWLEDKAPLRFEVEIASPPSTPEAGVIAVIQDGGLLPRPVPDPVVYDADGKLLASEVLWHNPAVGLAVVFAPPPGNKAVIYLKGGPSLPNGRGPAPFNPGLLLFTRETPLASLELAEKVPGTLAGSADTLMGLVPDIGQRENLFGNDDHYISYYTGWIKRGKAGRVYFATISDEGSELRVDGKPVASWPGLHTRHDGAKGQFGGWVELTAGLHRIDYFHFAKGSNPEAQAAWKIPGETSGDLPLQIPPGAFVHSGSAELTAAAFRDGRPVAAAKGNSQAVSYFWFLNAPVNLYHLEAALTGGNPADTVYTWSFDQDRHATGATVDWLVDGSAASTVELTAANKQGASRVTVPVFSCRSPEKAHVPSLADRIAYRTALLALCRAAAPDKDPCAYWSADLWATLVAVSEPYRGYDLLRAIFSRSPTALKVLKPSDRQFLEDVLIGVMRIVSPKDVAQWINRFVEAEADQTVRRQLKLELFDFTLYDQHDVAAARTLAADLVASALSPEDGALAQIRQGDVERAAGNIEEATRLYSTAQDRYRDAVSSSMALRSTRTTTVARPHGPERGEKPVAGGSRPAASAVTLRAASQSWKTFAVQEASFLATARNLIKQGDLFEARDVLRKWELEVPLCKLSGDYPLAEAEYYMAAQHYVRALAGLQIYRKGVDVSSSLPEAMDLEMECLRQLKKEVEAKELAKDIIKRFPNHPVAERARQVLEYGI